MTQSTKERLAYTRATQAIERLDPSREAIRCCEQVLEGSLSADEAVRRLLLKHRAINGGSHG